MLKSDKVHSKIIIDLDPVTSRYSHVTQNDNHFWITCKSIQQVVVIVYCQLSAAAATTDVSTSQICNRLYIYQISFHARTTASTRCCLVGLLLLVVDYGVIVLLILDPFVTNPNDFVVVVVVVAI